MKKTQKQSKSSLATLQKEGTTPAYKQCCEVAKVCHAYHTTEEQHAVLATSCSQKATRKEHDTQSNLYKEKVRPNALSSFAFLKNLFF